MTPTTQPLCSIDLSLLHGQQEASVIPIKTFSTLVTPKYLQGLVFVQSPKKKIAKDRGEQRDSEETKWHEACSASVKSDW